MRGNASYAAPAAVREQQDRDDSGAETAGSDCSKLSCSSINSMAVPGQEPLLLTMHLLTNPGDSLLLQHTIERLLSWICPGLHPFYVSEHACPLRNYTRAWLSPVAGYPSHTVTLFLHESRGEERILRVLEFLQCTPWQYHHTENFGGKVGEVHISTTTPPSNTLLRPYLLPSQDFYSLGVGMPVWGVRTVHYGQEVLRVTLHCTYDNFEDTVCLYETVLRRRAEEQKTGFCLFTLFTERGFSLQFAIKQLSPRVKVEPCYSSMLQFKVGEVGELVPLLPNTSSPISTTHWHTEDLDGNKILFHVKGPAQSQELVTSASPLSPSLLSRTLLRDCVSTRAPSAPPCSKLFSQKERSLGHSCVELPLDHSPHSLKLGPCSGKRFGSDSICSTPGLSSSYSSQCSSPAGRSVHQYEPKIPCETSISCFLPGEVEPETNIDTLCAVNPWPEGPTRASALENLIRDLKLGLPEAPCAVRESLGMVSPVTQKAHAQVNEFFI